MKTLSYWLKDLKDRTIPIGFVGENLYRRVIINCKEVFDDDPDLVPAISITPPKGDSYPGIVTRDGDLVYWDIQDSDLANKGNGEIQLSFVEFQNGVQVDNGIVGKSYAGRFRVERSIEPTGEAPEVLDDFIVEASAIVAAIPQTIDDALEEAKESGEFDGEDGYSPTVEITAITGGHRITITDADGTHTADVMDGEDGEPGDDGYSPTVSITSITGGHRITITDKNGDHTADIMDGQDGDPGTPGTPGADGVSPTVAITNIAGGHTVTITDKNGSHAFNVMDGVSAIDDNAGEGDTDKVWSADKSASEVSRAFGAINAKADEPTGTKSAGKVYGLNSSLQPVWVDQQGGGGSVDPEDIAAAVANWCEENITEDPTVIIDTSLLVSGAAADSKVVGDAFNDISEVVHSKNLYNPADCHPENGKQYNTYGNTQDAERYAITGKMPVDGSTQYIFSIGGIGKVKKAFYYKGVNGETYISQETLDDAAFTTPSDATFVAFTLFASTHTTAQYDAAIAVAMLEKGNVATDYVPYFVKRMVPTESLVDSDALEGAVNYTLLRSLVNLFDKAIAVDGKYLNNVTHLITENADYAFSGLIPVNPNSQYCYSKDKSITDGALSSTYAEWDEDKTFIQNSTTGAATTHINQIHTGSTTKYISFNITYSSSHSTQDFNDLIDTIMVVEGCQRPLDYIPYNNEPVVNHLKFDDMYQQNADRFRGKKWLVTGTSVSYQDSKVYTEGVAEGELVRGYIGNICRRKPMIVTNEAVSGSTLAGSDENSLINRYQNLNMGSYDFITIEYGINDFGNNVPVGTASDAAGTNTFAACLKTIIEYALNQNPIVGLIICTDPDVRGTATNQNGNTLKDYADVTIAIAEQYRLPVCDWFYHGGFNPITRGDGTSRYFLTQSGTHPSVYGHMRMAGMLNQVFDSLLC